MNYVLAVLIFIDVGRLLNIVVIIIDSCYSIIIVLIKFARIHIRKFSINSLILYHELFLLYIYFFVL